MSSFVRRAAFALAFLDYNVLGSGAIDDDSQMLWVRNVRDRLTKLAPFLSYDGDPYPVVVDGRVQWVVDAYTTTSRYPYAQRIGNDVQLTRDSGLDRDANYVRNSVKAVVDAYDGSVASTSATPRTRSSRRGRAPSATCSRRATRCPPSCASTCATPRTCSACRPTSTPSTSSTPERLLRARGRVVGGPGAEHRSRGSRRRGTRTAPTTDRRPAAPADLASESSTSRFIPVLHDVRRRRPARATEFVLLRPFVPFSRADQRTELQAYMTASSDPDTYGAADGVRRAGAATPTARGPSSNQIDSEPTITQQITLQTGGGNRVRFGDLQLVPRRRRAAVGAAVLRRRARRAPTAARR